MQYRVIEPYLKIETAGGAYTLYRGQLVILPSDIGLQLYQEGKVKPVTDTASCEHEPFTCDHSVFAEQVIQGNLKQWVDCGLYRGICNRHRGEWG
jgi:hypothetical protein